MDRPAVGRLPLEDRLLKALELFEPLARAELLTVLTSSEAVRADLIKQFWGRQVGHPVAELLMDLRGGPSSSSCCCRAPPGEPPIP